MTHRKHDQQLDTPDVKRPSRPDTEYPRNRGPAEFGTHEGGRNRPPRDADSVHGNPPRR